MLAALFIIVPAIEIAVILEVGGALGFGPTLLVIAVTAVVGAALARSQGFAAVRQVQQSLATGSRVGRSLLEAALVLAAAVLMLTPGFVTDAVGILLLLPPTRAVVARHLGRVIERRIARGDVIVMSPFGARGRPPHDPNRDRRDRGEGDPPDVIDV